MAALARQVHLLGFDVYMGRLDTSLCTTVTNVGMNFSAGGNFAAQKGADNVGARRPLLGLVRQFDLRITIAAALSADAAFLMTVGFRAAVVLLPRCLQVVQRQFFPMFDHSVEK